MPPASFAAVAAVLLLELSSGAARAQERAPGDQTRPLRYADAVRMALEGNPELAAARAEAERIEGEALQTWRGLLPTVRGEQRYIRSDDPSAVFGMKLKQRRLVPADLTPERLADPDPFGGYTTALIVEQPLVNLDAWHGRRQAREGVRAARLGTGRAEEELLLQVRRAYYALPLASARIVAVRQGLAATERAVAQASSLEREGLVSRVDVLQARVREAEIRAELAEAEADFIAAEAALRRVLGMRDEVAFTATDRIPEPSAVPSVEEARQAAVDRIDVRALSAGVDAARAGVGREQAALLPRLNAFGTYERSDDQPFGGRGSDRTIGVSLSWVPFDGMAQVGRIRAAQATVEREEARLQALRQQVDLEVRTAYARLGAARLRREQAEQAVSHAREAHRIAATRYRNNLAPITELLTAQAAETAAATRLEAARYDVVIAEGAYRLAAGLDLREK